MKSIEWRIRPGLIINEEEVVRSLKERGYYRSGLARSKEPAVQKTAATPTKPKRMTWPPKWVLRRMDRESKERFYAAWEEQMKGDR